MDPFTAGFLKEAGINLGGIFRSIARPAAFTAVGSGALGGAYVFGKGKGRQVQGAEDAELITEYMKQDAMRDAENMSRALEEGFRQGYQYAGAVKSKPQAK